MDLIALVIMALLFTLSLAYVSACDHMKVPRT